MDEKRKSCNKCGTSKLLTDFYNVKAAKDGKHGTCKACILKAQKEWRLAHPDVVRERARQYAAAHREEAKTRARAWYAQHKDRASERAKRRYQENAEEVKARARAYHARNRDACNRKRAQFKKDHPEITKAARLRYCAKNRDHVREKNKRWWDSHPWMKSAYAQKRRFSKQSATPPWLNEKMERRIAAMYRLRDFISRRNGIQYHVDHIIPLQGETVCGLHVHWNLQILTAVENVRKSNKLQVVA